MTDASATAPRRPGEQALTALGLGAPALDPADASPHSFPGGGRWRTEVPSCEGPEALAVVLKEASASMCRCTGSARAAACGC